MQYNKNQNVSLLSAPIPIKYLPDVKKSLNSLISPSIKECYYSDAWKSVARHCSNGISHVQGIDFDQSYSLVAHSVSFRINITIVTMRRLTASILDISNAFQNANFPIHERVSVSPPPYYLEFFERSYPNVTFNQDDGTFCLRCMNVIQGIKPAVRKWNLLLGALVTILKYKISTIDHTIYTKVFSGVTVSYLTFSTDDVLNDTNN